jgi:hypothetical protein
MHAGGRLSPAELKPRPDGGTKNLEESSPLSKWDTQRNAMSEQTQAPARESGGDSQAAPYLFQPQILPKGWGPPHWIDVVASRRHEA